METAQKYLLRAGVFFILFGLSFAFPAHDKNWAASNAGGQIIALGEAFLLLSIGARMLANGE